MRRDEKHGNENKIMKKNEQEPKKERRERERERERNPTDTNLLVILSSLRGGDGGGG